MMDQPQWKVWEASRSGCEQYSRAAESRQTSRNSMDLLGHSSGGAIASANFSGAWSCTSHLSSKANVTTEVEEDSELFDSQPEKSDTEDPEDLDIEVCYSIKFVNPAKKSDYIIRKWRFNQKFRSVPQLIAKLSENFKEFQPIVRQEDVCMGYIEPGHGYKGKQQWIYSDEDLLEMYSTYSKKKEILLWCFIPGKGSKRIAPRETTPAKRAKAVESNEQKVSQVQEIVSKLQSKHGSKFTPERYHAWAQLIQMGKQTSYEEPPNYSFFKDSKNKSSTVKGTHVSTSKSSPGKRVHLRTELFTQLEKLGNLHENGNLSKEQYDDLKKSIMEDIKEL